MADARHDVPLIRQVVRLGGWNDRLPGESTILRLRHALEKHTLSEKMLKPANAQELDVGRSQLDCSPQFNKKSSSEHDSEMKQSQKGQQRAT